MLAVTVHVPVRETVEVFAATAAVTAVPVAPDAGVHVNHDAFEETAHEAWFVVTVAVTERADAVGAQVVLDNDTVGTTAPACVTASDALAVPAVTVHVPVRDEVEVFAVTVAVTAVPVAPVSGVHVSHDAFEEADHEAWLVVTVAATD